MTFEDQAARILDSISFFGSGTEKQADQQRADAEDAIATALRAEWDRAMEEVAKDLEEWAAEFCNTPCEPLCVPISAAGLSGVVAKEIRKCAAKIRAFKEKP